MVKHPLQLKLVKHPLLLVCPQTPVAGVAKHPQPQDTHPYSLSGQTLSCEWPKTPGLPVLDRVDTPSIVLSVFGYAQLVKSSLLLSLASSAPVPGLVLLAFPPANYTQRQPRLMMLNTLAKANLLARTCTNPQYPIDGWSREKTTGLGQTLGLAVTESTAR